MDDALVSQGVSEVVGSSDVVESVQVVVEIPGTDESAEVNQVILEIPGTDESAEVNQVILESIGRYDLLQVPQEVTEIVGRSYNAESSQVVIEVFGGFGKVRTTETVIEILAGFGDVRVTQGVIEIIIYDPLPRIVDIKGSRGRPSSLRFGIGGYVTVEGLITTQLSPVVPVDPVNISFRPVRTRLAARFSGAQIVDILDGRPSFIAPWNSIRITADPTDQITNVLAGEEARLDIISLAMYGREDYWWVIAQANDIQNPFEEPFAGDRIRIPSLARILRILGQSGTGTEANRFKP